MAGTAQTFRGKPSHNQSHRGFKIGLKQRDRESYEASPVLYLCAGQLAFGSVASHRLPAC